MVIQVCTQTKYSKPYGQIASSPPIVSGFNHPIQRLRERKRDVGSITRRCDAYCFVHNFTLINLELISATLVSCVKDLN